ncbi:MAG: rod shape-determining protein MreC [Bacteroidales bacterium]|nr:rod shape-determining protein MreC [Bacteroidales bacterium]
MRNLLDFLLKYINLIVFIILEGIALALLGTANNYHNSRFINGVRGMTIGIEKQLMKIRTYFVLREINQTLASENISLRHHIELLEKQEDKLFFFVSDTSKQQWYQYTLAEVIDNSVSRQKNYFTLNKGLRDGLSTEMAVTSGDAVAGVVVGCTDNFSVAMSLLNLDFRLSARIKSSGYFGSLSWDGRNDTQAILTEIPQHITINQGDTVETTGYSAIFPEGIMIGTISDFERTGSDFYKITVSLMTDFRKLHYVNVIGNLKKAEQVGLEKQFE